MHSFEQCALCFYMLLKQRCFGLWGNYKLAFSRNIPTALQWLLFIHLSELPYCTVWITWTTFHCVQRPKSNAHVDCIIAGVRPSLAKDTCANLNTHWETARQASAVSCLTGLDQTPLISGQCFESSNRSPLSTREDSTICCFAFLG